LPATEEEIKASALQFVRKLSASRGLLGRTNRVSTEPWKTWPRRRESFSTLW
jgi:hypothetical protein